MRISRVEVQKRQAFVTNYFRQNPKNTIREAQAALKAEFGQEMKPTTVIQLRAQVLSTFATPAAVPAPAVVEAETKTEVSTEQPQVTV